MRDAGVEVAALENRPEVPLLLGSVWEAFNFISAGRQGSFGNTPAPLPTADIAGLIAIFKPEQPEKLARQIRALDSELLRFYSARHGPQTRN